MLAEAKKNSNPDSRGFTFEYKFPENPVSGGGAGETGRGPKSQYTEPLVFGPVFRTGEIRTVLYFGSKNLWEQYAEYDRWTLLSVKKRTFIN